LSGSSINIRLRAHGHMQKDGSAGGDRSDGCWVQRGDNDAHRPHVRLRLAIPPGRAWSECRTQLQGRAFSHSHACTPMLDVRNVMQQAAPCATWPWHNEALARPLLHLRIHPLSLRDSRKTHRVHSTPRRLRKYPQLAFMVCMCMCVPAYACMCLHACVRCHNAALAVAAARLCVSALICILTA
jgi:hypothetical protein